MVFGPGKKGEKKGREFTAFQYEEVTVGEPAGSFIGKTTKIKGKIVADEDLTIEGEVKGTVKANKTLTIGRSGNVNADIKASVVEIFGVARGNIAASEKVVIMSDGRYNGNLQSKKLVVEEGAVLIGDINKELETEKPTPKTRKKTPPPQGETEAKKTERPEEKKEEVSQDSQEPNESEQ